jgi:hypothetical protein
MKTKSGTWDAIEDLGVKFDPSKGLRFRITVFDCDKRGGKHLLIGMSDMDTVDLSRMSERLLPVLRDGKVKGFLRLVDFQLIESV